MICFFQLNYKQRLISVGISLRGKKKTLSVWAEFEAVKIVAATERGRMLVRKAEPFPQ